jgi:hypothetical protein
VIYKTEDLVTSVQRRTLAPNAQPTYQTTEIVAFLNEELQLSLCSDILSVREDFFLRKRVIPMVAGVRVYGVPERASGNAMKKIFYISTNGEKFPLRRYGIDAFAGNDSQTGAPHGFMLFGDEILLDRTPQTDLGSLEVWYFARPNQLVPTSEVAKIEAVTPAADSVVFTVDTDLTSLVPTNGEVDFLCAKSPFFLWAEDAVVTSITTNSVTVSLASVVNAAGVVMPQTGDYICPAQKSNIPQIPQEFHPLLAQMAGCRILEGLGDLNKLQMAEAKLDKMRRQAFQLIANRV